MHARPRWIRSAWTLLVGVAVVWSPELARACAVCTAGREEENQFAFLITTIGMSILPLAMIGGVVWWLRSRARAAEAESSQWRAEAAPPPRPSAGVTP